MCETLTVDAICWAVDVLGWELRLRGGQWTLFDGHGRPLGSAGWRAVEEEAAQFPGAADMILTETCTHPERGARTSRMGAL